MPPFVPGAAPRHTDSPDAAPAEPYEPEPADDLQLTSDRPSQPSLDSGATSDLPTSEGEATLDSEAALDSETTPFPEPPRDPEPLNAEPWAGAVELDSVDALDAVDAAEPWAAAYDGEPGTTDPWQSDLEADAVDPWEAVGGNAAGASDTSEGSAGSEAGAASPAADEGAESAAAEPWAEAEDPPAGPDTVAEPWAGTPEPVPSAPGDDPAPWDTPDAWADSVADHPDDGPAEPDTGGAPSGALPEAFFADAFYTPHMIEQSEVDDAPDAEQVMAEQVAERLADLSRQIRERGFSALAETVDPDQLSRIIAGIVAGFVARAEPDE